MGMLIKAVTFIAILSTFAILIGEWAGEGSVTNQGWVQFADSIGKNPFVQCSGIVTTNCIPAWPTFPGPASENTTTGSLYFRETNSAQVNCPRTLSRIPGVNPASTVTLNAADAYECWLFGEEGQNYNGGNWSVDIWLSSSGSPTYTWAIVGWNTFFGGVGFVVCSDDSETALGTPVELFCPNEGNPYTDLVLAFQIRWLFGANLVVSYDAVTEITSITPPGWFSSGSDCVWYSPLSWGSCAGDASTFAGAGFLYIGGLIWTGLNYIGGAIGWVLGVIIGFFGGLIGTGGFIVTLGGTAPSEISTIILGVFVVFMAIILLEIIRTIRGASPV